MLNKDVSAGKSVVPKGSGQGVVKDSEVDSNSTAEPIVEPNYDNNNENIKEKNYRSSFLLFRPLLLLLNWIDGVIYVYYQSISLEVHDITKVKSIIEECGGLSYEAEIKKGLKELKFQNLANKEKRSDQYDIWIPGNYPYKVLFWFKWLNHTYTYYVLLHIMDMKGYFTSFNPLKEFKDNLILGHYKLDKLKSDLKI